MIFKFNVMKAKTLLLLCLLVSACAKQTSRINLAGTWQFTTDSTQWDNTITLPGSMTSNGFGEDISVSTNWTGGIVDPSFFKKDSYRKYREKDNVKVPFWLQPVKYYKGMAWYKKEITIPEDWNKKDISLFLERCHWETCLYIDGKKIGMQNALGAPHRYDLTGLLTSGRHMLMLQVDNRIKDIDPGINSHSISDHTQGNWNGVVGDIYLEAKPQLNITSATIYPNIAQKAVLIRSKLMNRRNETANATLTLKVENKTIERSVQLQPGNNEIEVNIPLDTTINLWDEFHPYLYTLEMCLTDESQNTKDIHTDRFGFRDFKVIDGKLTINGRQVFLRGTLDCAAFPKTGYPPTDTDSWRKIYRACLDHGLNHVRFHSWCPPKAAFIAADEMGLYLEIECSSWANQSTTIGDGRPLDKFIWEESAHIINEFGNHPSFCMMMYGNEPAGGGSGKYLSEFVSTWKKRDDRRLYCSSAGWPNLPESDFLSDPSPRIQGWGQGLNSIINAEAPRTNYDWFGYTGKFNQPMISHEIGQWCVYPNFKEMKKYDGVMQPKNFEIFQETLKENGMAHLADSFLLASGKLQALCYKADIEAALRTKDMGGFQLLGLYDFPGQGTALVGVLDAFWEEKGYITPDEYKQFCNSTVPLIRLPKLIYSNNEVLKGSVEIAHFGPAPLKVTSTSWNLKTKNGEQVASGLLNHPEIAIGNCIELGNIETKLDFIDKASKLILEIKTGDYTNNWNLWVYPTTLPKVRNEEQILMVDQLNEEALQRLEKGGKVLLSLRKGTLAKEMGGEVQIGFSSIFWNTAWTMQQAPHTLGILCNPKHPALAEFPTEYHSDYQWWDAMSHSGAIEIAKISPDINPIVRVIDDWFTNRPLALIFEVKVGNGQLLVSGIDFWQDMDNRIEARQLLHSLKTYMTGKEFNPTLTIKPENIKNL